MDYIEGFVAAVPSANKDAFIEHASKAAKLFREHGTSRVVECWGDDVPSGTHTSFLQAVQCREDETVVFSWIAWPSRQARDAGMEKVMNDPRMSNEANPMPFDGKRLIFGGFQTVVDA